MEKVRCLFCKAKTPTYVVCECAESIRHQQSEGRKVFRVRTAWKPGSVPFLISATDLDAAKVKWGTESEYEELPVKEPGKALLLSKVSEEMERCLFSNTLSLEARVRFKEIIVTLSIDRLTELAEFFMKLQYVNPER